MNVNQTHPDDLDELERKYLAPNLFNQPDSDAEHGAEEDFNSDWSMDEDEHQKSLELEELFDPKNAQVVEEEGWSSVLSKNRPKNNTGGKGVLADYKEAQKITKRRNETKALKQQEAWKRLGYNAEVKAPPPPPASKSSQSKDEQEEEDSDDEFFKAFRASRIGQFSSVSSLPQFGRVRQVGKFEFVDQVDQADKRTFVVVHVFEPYLIACTRINFILDDIASRFPHVCFLKLLATEADQTLSHRALPAFLVYKGGHLVNEASMFNKREDAAATISVEDVEFLLASKYGVNLPGVDVSPKETQ